MEKIEKKNTTLKEKKTNTKIRPNRLQFKSKVVEVRRVSKTVKGGKKLTFSVVIIVGDESGKVGVGVGRASDVPAAAERATANAQKHLIQVPISVTKSIPHVVQGKFGSCNVLVKPAKAGTGVIAGGPVRTVLELAGLKNILAKQLGSSNIINNARATLVALSSTQAAKDICEDRGISIKNFRERVLSSYN